MKITNTGTAPWNGQVEPGKSVYIGLNGSGSGADPTAFTINGKACKSG